MVVVAVFEGMKGNCIKLAEGRVHGVVQLVAGHDVEGEVFHVWERRDVVNGLNVATVVVHQGASVLQIFAIGL